MILATLAAAGDAPPPQERYAQYQLAEHYDQDDSIPGNEEKAIFWFTRAAQQGLTEAQDELGNHFLDGHGVAKDRRRALFWYRAAARQGDPQEEAKLATLLENDGRCRDRDCREAAKWRGAAAAQYRSRAEANPNDRDPEIRLAVLLYRDGRCSNGDCAEAARWFQAAANRDPAYAARMLGDMYLTGVGVQRSPATAADWYKKAADKGDGTSACGLGRIYELGLTGARDMQQAYYWYAVAASVFSSQVCRASAAGALDRLRPTMTPDDLAKATALAAQWLDAHEVKRPPLF